MRNPIISFSLLLRMMAVGASTEQLLERLQRVKIAFLLVLLPEPLKMRKRLANFPGS
jgi:hypothetical protein